MAQSPRCGKDSDGSSDSRDAAAEGSAADTGDAAAQLSGLRFCDYVAWAGWTLTFLLRLYAFMIKRNEKP